MLSIIISLLCARWLMLVIYILFLYLPTIKTRYLHKYFISTPSLEPPTKKKQFHLYRNLQMSEKNYLSHGMYGCYCQAQDLGLDDDTDFWLLQRRDATPPRQQGRAWLWHPAPASHLGPGVRWPALTSPVHPAQHWQQGEEQFTSNNNHLHSTESIVYTQQCSLGLFWFWKMLQ